MKGNSLETKEKELCKCGHTKALHAKILKGKNHPNDMCYGTVNLTNYVPV